MSSIEELHKQELLLKSLPIEQLMSIVHCAELAFSQPHNWEAIAQLTDRLYASKLVFDFAWSEWSEGINRLQKQTITYDQCSLLEVSKYLTLIVRGDRFNEGLLDNCIKNGVLQQLIDALKERAYRK